MRGASLLLIAACLVSPAAASVAVRADVEDLAESAEFIADGVVVDHATTFDSAAGAISTVFLVRVTTTLAGDEVSLVMVRVPGGRVGTMTQQVIGAPELTDGTRVVLFLGPAERGARPVIGLAQGAFRVETDPATGATTCCNRLAGLSLVDRYGNAASAEPLALTLDAMVKRVAAGRGRAEARQRTAREAAERRIDVWRRAAQRRSAATRGRPGGAEDR